MNSAQLNHVGARALSILPCILALSVGGTACDGAESPAAKPASAAHAAKVPAAAERAPTPEVKPSSPGVEAKGTPGPAVTDPTFDLVLSAAGPYKAGELGRAVLSLKPKGIYHVNQEYPVRIEIAGPSEISVAKATLEKGDAAEFTDTGAKFDVPFTPSVAGEFTLAADVDFAVCTEETCVPDQRKLALTLSVE